MKNFITHLYLVFQLLRLDMFLLLFLICYFWKFRRSCSSGLYNLTFMDDSKKFPLNNTSSFLVANNADEFHLCTRPLVTTNIVTLLSWLYPADITAVYFLFFCSSLGGCESASTSGQLFNVFQISLLHRICNYKCFYIGFPDVLLISRMGN